MVSHEAIGRLFRGFLLEIDPYQGDNYDNAQQNQRAHNLSS